MGEAKENIYFYVECWYPFKCRAPLKMFLHPQIQNPKPHALNPFKSLNPKMLKAYTQNLEPHPHTF
jgi:hypothetical protein